MKSPVDAVIAERQGPAPEVRSGAPAKPAGGKALMRMLGHMDRRGLHGLADRAIDSKVEPDARALVQASRTQFSPSPEPHRSGDAATAASAARPAGPGEETAPRVAEMYAAVARSRLPATPVSPPDAPGEGRPAIAPVSAGFRLGVPTSPPTPAGPQWRSLGPWTVPNGQTYGSSRVNVSGRVSSIAIHPANPARVLCGAANGGVWESFDRGASWAPRTDFATTLAVGALAYDRSNPNFVYCGLGEGNWWSWLGTGVLRSVDGGTTWSQLCTAPFVGRGFYDLQVSPSNGQRLVAATTGGLHVSSDGGTTWAQRRTPTTWSIAIAPGPVDTAEMLAASSDGVYRSVDGGSTWAAVAIAGAPASFDRLAVAIAASNPSVAYAWGANGATAYLFRRAAGVWTAMPLPPGVSTGQAWYDWFLGAAPDRDDQVYVGAIDSYRADLSGSAWAWTALSNKGSSGDSIHPDQHAIAFEPGQPNTV